MSFGTVVIVFFLGAFTVGLAAMVMEHLRRMAEIQNRRRNDDVRIEALERRVEDLSALVHEQTIALDGVARLSSPELRVRH